MEITQHKLYAYSDVRRLLLRGDEFSEYNKDNANMNTRNMKLHKGVDNILYFRAFSPNGVPSNVTQYKLYGRIIRPDTGEQVLERLCQLGVADGTINLSINEGDLVDIEPGLYNIAIVGTQDLIQSNVGETTLTPFFTDFSSNVAATVEITDQIQREPVPSIELTSNSWTEDREDNGIDPGLTSFFISQAIPGSRSRNHVHNVHTFSVETDAFYGRVEVLGTLDLTPNPDPKRGWFTISALDLGEDFIEFVNVTGNRFFTFEGNYMWIKFKYTPSIEVVAPGSLVKLIART